MIWRALESVLGPGRALEVVWSHPCQTLHGSPERASRLSGVRRAWGTWKRALDLEILDMPSNAFTRLDWREFCSRTHATQDRHASCGDRYHFREQDRE